MVTWCCPLDEGNDAFFDEIESAGDELEVEADEFASSALIPLEEWKAFRDSGDRSAANVRRAALRWNIHPAIVAGRLRRELRNYRLLAPLVGQGAVRPLLLAERPRNDSR